MEFGWWSGRRYRSRDRRFVARFGNLLAVGGLALIIAASRNPAGVPIALAGLSALVLAIGFRHILGILVAWVGMDACYEGALYPGAQIAIAIGSAGTLIYVVEAFWISDRGNGLMQEAFDAERTQGRQDASLPIVKMSHGVHGKKIGARPALWSGTRYAGRPRRVVLGVASLTFGTAVFGLISAGRGNLLGVGLAAVGCGLLLAAVGLRNPLGSIPAFIGVVLAVTPALWGRLGGAVPLLCSASLFVIIDAYWRRDGEEARN